MSKIPLQALPTPDNYWANTVWYLQPQDYSPTSSHIPVQLFAIDFFPTGYLCPTQGKI